MGSAALGCARPGPAQSNSDHLGSAWLGSARLGFILMAELRCQMFGWKSRIFGGPNDAPAGSSARELAFSSEAPKLDSTRSALIQLGSTHRTFGAPARRFF